MYIDFESTARNIAAAADAKAERIKADADLASGALVETVPFVSRRQAVAAVASGAVAVAVLTAVFGILVAAVAWGAFGLAIVFVEQARKPAGGIEKQNGGNPAVSGGDPAGRPGSRR